MSVTEAMLLVAPVYPATVSTSRSPAVLLAGNLVLSVVAAAVSVAPADCTSRTVLPLPMVRPTVTVWVAELPVPVTVTVLDDGGVPAATLIVMMELDPAVIVEGLKVAVAPAGSPLAVSAMPCATPLVTELPMVTFALPPGATVTAPGLALSEKSFVTGWPWWQVRVPLSVQDLPASGTNRQS